MKEQELKMLVLNLWDIDYGDERPRSFHAALDYTEISEALGTKFYPDADMEALMERFNEASPGIRDESENPEAEKYLFDLLYQFDRAQESEDDDGQRAFWFDNPHEEIHSTRMIRELLLERYFAETYMKLGWIKDDGLERMMRIKILMKDEDCLDDPTED
jgi:hypothetical protein